ncbi:hypothetical protein BDZ94DRAFT_850181 [Collybia nuda]|uniref:Uncharacterized protein n=1 Tax=Collybia nuda TaxID=64659 RepID=A0A9P5YFA4_9AGAR|nr:hypothetical protein BDZ94DRAFT_850181 [Collybia nuda]
MNSPCPFGGLQVLIPRNSASSTRTTWPPKYTDHIPLLDPMIVDLTEQENIRVRFLNDVCPSRSPFTLRGPGTRGSQPIPNRTLRSRTPTMDAISTLTSNDVLRPSRPISPPVTEVSRTTRRPNTQRRITNTTQAPIGSERLRRSTISDDMSVVPARLLPGKSTSISNSDEHVSASISPSYLSVLSENAQRHPHAPRMSDTGPQSTVQDPLVSYCAP